MKKLNSPFWEALPHFCATTLNEAVAQVFQRTHLSCSRK
jgi:hypothetical protein